MLYNTLLLYNPNNNILLYIVEKEKKVCPFFLLENSRTLSPWGPLDSLSTCLGNDSLTVQFLSCVRLFATPWIAARLPVHHQLPKFTETHVHQVGDAIQPSHPLSSPSPPAPNPSQHQSLFQWVNSWREAADVSEFQPQDQSFQWTPRTGLL